MFACISGLAALTMLEASCALAHGVDHDVDGEPLLCLEALAGLPQLREQIFSGRGLSAACLPQLSRMGLSRLDVADTCVLHDVQRSPGDPVVERASRR